MAEKETGRKAISLRSDNEYVNEEVGALLSSLGITHERSPPYVKQANGSRKFPTIIELLLLSHYNIYAIKQQI